MATMITSDCINCGACEAECPNTAIYQGGVDYELDGVTQPALDDGIFYIVPEKCTECVGFFEQEACAVVCPVDCCIPNPSIPETEDVLLARATRLHPDQTFGDEFPSRFRGGAESVAASAAASSATESAAAPHPAPLTGPVAPPPSESVGVSISDVNDWDVPIWCHRCEEDYTIPFRLFRPGVVFSCPNCGGSLVVNSSMFTDVSRALDDFHGKWTAAFETFRDKRRRELDAFEETQRAALERFSDDLKQVVADAKPAGRRHRRLSSFGFQRVG